LALVEIDAICAKCRGAFRAKPTRSFLGFQKLTCPHCSHRVLYPLTSAYRTTYWVILALMAVAVYADLAGGGIATPSPIVMLVILALVRDARMRKQLVQGSGRGFKSPDRDEDPQGVAYRMRGSLDHWCTAQNFAPEYLFAFAEFGTYSNIPVIAGLRAENQAHHCGRPDDPRTTRAKERLRELFCPASGEWRSRALAQSIDLVEKAMTGVLGETSFLY